MRDPALRPAAAGKGYIAGKHLLIRWRRLSTRCRRSPSGTNVIDRRAAKQIYRSMLVARSFEESLIRAMGKGESVQVGHPSSGQEGVASAVCEALADGDQVFCGHRAKHWAVSKGCDLNALAAEYWGKATGIANGLGGEMHSLDKNVGFMGSNHVVGGNLPVAVGAALAAKLSGSQRIVAVAFGDGASVQGAFHEALNLAAVLEVPILFVCENNLYAESTPVEYHSKPPEIYKKATPYGIPSVRLDGQDALEVYTECTSILNDMREDQRPRFVEMVTYRFGGHYYGDDTGRYRTTSEEEMWLSRDPIDVFQARAEDSEILSQSEMAQIVEQANVAVENAMSFAKDSPLPDINKDSARVFVD